MKYCKKCSQEKDFVYFSKAKNTADGLRYYCKECDNKANKVWYANNKERRKKTMSKWMENNKYYFSDYYKKWAEENKVKLRKYHELWYLENKERILKLSKVWWCNNPEKRKLYKAAYYTKQRNQLGYVTPNIEELLMAAQENRCFYCGNDLYKYHLEHMVPISRGGLHDDSNLCLSCPRCNLRKNDKTAEEFIQQLMEENKWQ